MNPVVVLYLTALFPETIVCAIINEESVVFSPNTPIARDVSLGKLPPAIEKAVLFGVDKLIAVFELLSFAINDNAFPVITFGLS